MIKKALFPLLILTIAAATHAGVIPVELRQTEDGFALYRGGEPYYVKGAGALGSLQALKDAGGNSVRIWGDAERSMLDEAHALGLSVCVGFWIQHERHGFDYDDPVAVREQIALHTAVIDELKDHPAVLMWAIGNEVELQSTNHKVWDVIEEIAAYAKKVDPNHPTMTVVAHAPKKDIHLIMDHAPSIDILGCNSYGGIFAIANDVREAGWTGPYMVTEWGTDGMWESDKTSWGAEIEATSTVKAEQIRERFDLIRGDAGRCIGSYVFLWGAKQETTPTWFNLFLETGEALEGVDALQYAWTGSYPEHLAPRIDAFTLEGRIPQVSIELASGETAHAAFQLSRNASPVANIHWEILSESTDKRLGGDRELRPDAYQLKVVENKGTSMTFVAPRTKGNYRLFLYVRDGRGKAATANIPFTVGKPAE